jgi:hypothetical protein
MTVVLDKKLRAIGSKVRALCVAPGFASTHLQVHLARPTQCPAPEHTLRMCSKVDHR